MNELKKESPAILVVGAGVIGLTTALTLTRAGYKNVQVAANHMPADREVEYTSQWAGVDFVPVSKGGSREAGWDETTWHEMLKLANSKPGAGIWLQNRTKYWRNEDQKQEDLNEWAKDLVFNYKFLGKDEVPDFADWGTFYTTITLDPHIYLHWLQSNCLEAGVKFQRAYLQHIREAWHVTSSRPDIVINCTGVMAAKLGGVNDQALKPMLGQMVIVANEVDGIYCLSGDNDRDASIGESCYVIPRPAGGGTAIGGCAHESWSKEPNPELAERMMKRAIKVAPGLVPAGAGIEALRVVRHQVGWRPHRDGGARVEREIVDDAELGLLNLVHAYGTGSFGYQSSYGVATLVVELVKASLGS